ncbi:MAG: hypothetical protein JOY99_08850 [Sphingomonadaceae bacterium]|nr:hypothetical protein [Sphingomonadaceae bacterium]
MTSGSCSFATMPGNRITADQILVIQLIAHLAFDAARHLFSVISADPIGLILTRRQREILLMLASGRTEAEVGTELGISRLTVSSQMKLARQSCGASSTLSLLSLAIARGEIDPTELHEKLPSSITRPLQQARRAPVSRDPNQLLLL